MGDYTKSGEKIGTCGNAYYATLPMLKVLAQDPTEQDSNYYTNPKNSCTFAFPFPAYDGKSIGQFSNFHDGERADFFFDLPSTIESHHTEISHHINPKGGQGVNLYTDCPSAGGKVFNNFHNAEVRYRLTGQVYFEGALCITAKCVYCEQTNIFSKEEAQLICEWIKTRKHSSKADEDYYTEIAKRIIETYN